MAGQADVLVLLILAFIFPPAAVAFVAGCGADFCLNVLLTILGYLPGLIHACWLVLRRAEANERYGYKNWTYSGMGEYAPMRPANGSGQQPASYGTAPPQPPPPPPGQYPADQAPPPPSQAPVDQKSSGNAPPPAPPEQKYGGYQAPPQAPTDQKAVDVSPPAPADQKPGDSTAPASGT